MTILEIKEMVTRHLGEFVLLKCKQPRKSKLIEYQGKISDIYDNLFIVNVCKSYNYDLSINYRDILTKNVEIEFSREM